MMLAIDPDTNLVYEGSSGYGHAVWPSPVISVANLIIHESDLAGLPKNNDLASANLIFREDSFDPVTRVKRGRFYDFQDGTKSPQWQVQVHPMRPSEHKSANREGLINKQLWNWHRCTFSLKVKSLANLPVVALGTASAHTLWRIVGLEGMATGEELVTLRAKANLGVLPEVDEDKLPDVSKAKVIESLDKLVETVYRLGPESVVSRCRDAASAVLGAFLWAVKRDAPTKDLGDLINILKGEKNPRTLIISAATIIARLHPREKPNEQIKRDLRSILEEDAELAVNCIGLLMREVGYAKP